MFYFYLHAADMFNALFKNLGESVKATSRVAYRMASSVHRCGINATAVELEIDCMKQVYIGPWAGTPPKKLNTRIYFLSVSH